MKEMFSHLTAQTSADKKTVWWRYVLLFSEENTHLHKFLFIQKRGKDIKGKIFLSSISFAYV